MRPADDPQGARGETMTGRFLVTRLDYAGDFNGERSYTLNLESSGAVVAA